MLKIEISPQALEDLGKIWFYTFSTRSEKQANFYHDNLLLSISSLSKLKENSKTFSYQSKTFQYLKFEKYLIFFKIEEDKIQIARVLHEMMDFVKHL